MASSCTSDPKTPAWVMNVREEINRSPAWEVLSDQLYEQVSTVLESHGLGHFSDLSSAEQITLLEEAHRDISSEENKVYKAFESQFGKSMDAEIAKEARARVDQDEAAKRDGTDEALYLDRILDSAAEGAVSLLKELPREHLGNLRLMLNQPIPSRARLDIWRLLLKHTAVREEYELLMKQNRNSTISGQDVYITHRCQTLLESGRVASRRLLPLTSRNVVLMKTVLSYHHARKMGKQGDKAAPDVPESFLHFLVPLCTVATSPSSSHGSHPREHKIESQIEGLVEMFEGGLEAGLEGLVDPKELGGGGSGSGEGGGAAAAGGVVTTRSKKTQKAPKKSRTVEPPVGVGGDGAGEVVLPRWVDKVHDVLVPGFKGLVDHVTRVHLGLAVAASSEGRPSEHKKEGGSDGDDDEASSGAAHGNLQAEKKDSRQQQLEGEGTAQPPSPRPVSPSSRRAALKSRRRPPPSSAAPDNARGGGEGEKTGDNPTRRLSSIVSSGEEADNVKNALSIPSDTAPLPGVNESQARGALHALLKPLVAVGLVGYLSADACLFAWDQAVIGGFGVMLPRVAAMVVAAAADKMQACSTFPVLSEALLSHAHLVSTSQLQELMEAHCMPSIRTEMRVSQKLSPEIVGPSLKTATEILHRTYSKRTTETQKARKKHVEHVLGPAKGGPINRINTKERLQLDLPRSAAHGSSGSSKGDSSVDLQYDDSDDDDDDDNADDTKGKKSASAGLGKVRGGLDDRERQDEDRGGEAKEKGKWRGMLSHQSASSTVASVDGVGEATLARDKAGDHGGSTRKTIPSKRDTKKVEGAAASTSGSAFASVSSSRKAGGKRGENKAAASDVPDVNNKKAKPKPKTKTKTKTNSSYDHDSTNESAEDAKVVVVDDDGSDRKKPKSQKRRTAGATAGTRKDSSASSSLAQESTGRSLESSQYFSAESQSSHTRESERESSRDGEEKEAAAGEESAAKGPPQQPDTQKKEKSGSRRRRSSHSHVSRRNTEGDGRGDNSEKSAKSPYKTREVSKQKKKARTVAEENSISEGGAPAAAPSPEPPAAAAATSASTTAPVSPLKRWLGFGGRKKASASSPPSPAKGTKTTSRTKTNNMSSWMLD